MQSHWIILMRVSFLDLEFKESLCYLCGKWIVFWTGDQNRDYCNCLGEKWAGLNIIELKKGETQELLRRQNWEVLVTECIYVFVCSWQGWAEIRCRIISECRMSPVFPGSSRLLLYQFVYTYIQDHKCLKLLEFIVQFSEKQQIKTKNTTI